MRMVFKINFTARTFLILYIIQFVNFNVISQSGVIVLNNIMPDSSVTAIATNQVVLKPGFSTRANYGIFNAKIGNINSVYPLIQLGPGSTQVNSPQPTEKHSMIKIQKRTIIATDPIDDVNQLCSLNSNSIVEYSDGLGRNCMTVMEKFTPQKNDLVSIVNYDCFGHITNSWLPTPMNSGPVIDPGFVAQEAKNFYIDAIPYYSATRSSGIRLNNSVNEESSLSISKPGIFRMVEEKSFHQQFLSSDKSIPELFVRYYSIEGDNVRLFNDSNDSYRLYAKRSQDEDGNVKIIFIDSFGRIILNRAVNFGINHDTYFIYDDFENLRFVLSPEASDRMSTPGIYSVGNQNAEGNTLSQYAFMYKYDEKGRCIAKKLPGADWQKMIYDIAGRIAFSQDGNQRARNEWTFYKYDLLSRLIITGTTIISDGVNISNTYKNISATETYITGQGYSLVTPLGTSTVILTQNFYDSYDFINLNENSQVSGLLTYKTPIQGYGAKYEHLISGTDISTKGLLTGTSVKMLDLSSTLISTYYYNDRGQIVQHCSNNHLDGYDYSMYAYSFGGNLLRKMQVHKTPYITGEVIEVYKMIYDHAGRLLSIRHRLNDQNEILMDSLEYDNIGRLTKKHLHGGIQSIEYTYNLLNQIKSISSQKFSQTLYYENPPNSNNGLYNGSISANIFGIGSENRYHYSYDQLNRLVGASNGSENKFGEFVTGYDKNSNILGIIRNGYVYDYGYNLTHGAIDDLIMVYSGNQLKNVNDAANQQSVITTNDFFDIQNSNPVEYLYDNNGNMSSDLNRGIAWTRYNILNLPEKIQFRNGTKNEYLYDATGVKRSAGYNYSTNTSLIPLGDTDPLKENTASSTYKIDYCGNYVYEKQGTMPSILRRILTPEGYVQTYGGLMSHQGYWRYIYNLKDYQGNTRVFLTSDYIGNINSQFYTSSQQIDYYPFGMERSNTGQNSGGVFNSANNPYLYSGNETDRINGLNLYDFNARWLNAAIPGFTTQDPLAEYHFSENPYSYCGGDPVNRVDPLGLDWYSYNSGQNLAFVQGYHGVSFTQNGRQYRWEGTEVYFTDVYGRKWWGNEVGNLQLMSFPDVDIYGGNKSQYVDYHRLWAEWSKNWQGDAFVSKSPQGQGGSGWEPIVGTAGAIAGEMYYSKTYGTWMGKNFKMYQQTWGGNGATGGKLKFSKKVSTGIKIGGYGLGVWNAYNIRQQNKLGQISDGQMYMEQGSNLITTVGGLHGAAWGVGWELGRAVTNMEWYQEAKFNFWYNRWESQVGPPSQSNEALWYYFYQNYKP